jgi:hypothetical protein
MYFSVYLIHQPWRDRFPCLSLVGRVSISGHISSTVQGSKCFPNIWTPRFLSTLTVPFCILQLKFSLSVCCRSHFAVHLGVAQNVHAHMQCIPPSEQTTKYCPGVLPKTDACTQASGLTDLLELYLIGVLAINQ